LLLLSHFFFLFSFKYFEDIRELRHIINSLTISQFKGRAYVFGGLFRLIKSTPGTNWRDVVKEYVLVIKGFAAHVKDTSPVIVQLPWRDDSAPLFRVQRELVS
jgi:hypothetical protein